MAAVAAANLLAWPHLLRRDVRVECLPEMVVRSGLLDGAGPEGVVHELPGVRATWHLSGPGSLSNQGIETEAGLVPWRAEHARQLCHEGLPCALKVESESRFALLWVEPAEQGYAGALVVQDSADRRVTFSGRAEETAEGAACAALAGWFAFARTELAAPG
ncbi:hypothetical protein FHY55_17880 [Oceanicola sp. D3]|nr:hypothetical protein FHY55_17880 [Oceanicola sp. D3]